jgi:hypothetical protein
MSSRNADVGIAANAGVCAAVILRAFIREANSVGRSGVAAGFSHQVGEQPLAAVRWEKWTDPGLGGPDHKLFAW